MALPIAMIRDGRVRSASVLEAKRQARSERRSRQPAEIQQRQEQEERPKRSEVLSQAPWDAKRQERQQLPLYELLGRGFQFQQTTQVAARRAGNYVVLISESMDNASMPGALRIAVQISGELMSVEGNGRCITRDTIAVM